ncbi:hypothetical protein [Neomoorella thermoacetica]|uniref:hypothetical protein n=1 Tax=Neomoorella thermoacetica TaxID=1525 RepID=UPI0030CACD0E
MVAAGGARRCGGKKHGRVEGIRKLGGRRVMGDTLGGGRGVLKMGAPSRERVEDG